MSLRFTGEVEVRIILLLMSRFVWFAAHSFLLVPKERDWLVFRGGLLSGLIWTSIVWPMAEYLSLDTKRKITNILDPRRSCQGWEREVWLQILRHRSLTSMSETAGDLIWRLWSLFNGNLNESYGLHSSCLTDFTLKWVIRCYRFLYYTCGHDRNLIVCYDPGWPSNGLGVTNFLFLHIILIFLNTLLYAEFKKRFPVDLTVFIFDSIGEGDLLQ